MKNYNKKSTQIIIFLIILQWKTKNKTNIHLNLKY